MPSREKFWWFFGFVTVDLISLLGHYYSWMHSAGFIAALLGFTALSISRYETAVLVALAELFLGSFGHMLGFAVSHGEISLRLGLFTILMCVGLRRTIRSHTAWRMVLRSLRTFVPVLALGAVIFLGFVQGILRGYNFNIVFNDGNGYLFLAFMFPLILVMNRPSFRMRLQPLLTLAALYLAVKTLLLLYFFTHRFGFFLVDLYQWIRDTGEGELTPTRTGAYRIFLQSQIYLLVAWWIVLWRSRREAMHRATAIPAVVQLSLISGALLITFSRSFWLGLILSLTAFLILLGKRRRWSDLWRLIALMLGSMMLGTLLVIGVLRFPYPEASSQGSLELEERLQLNESALSSRWNLLGPLWSAVKEYPVFGAGFGKTVTYVSNDPRIRAENPSGRYTTTAFEWGYLGMWLKIGLLGLVAYGAVIWKIIRNAWQTDRLYGESLGLILGLGSILGVHIGSPYLDHPLGLGFVVLLYTYFCCDAIRDAQMPP